MACISQLRLPSLLPSQGPSFTEKEIRLSLTPDSLRQCAHCARSVQSGSGVRMRQRRGSSSSCRASQDFFQSDVVEYGSRYNRPDRFPRLKQADRRRRNVDVVEWLTRLCEIATACGFQEVYIPTCEQAVHGSEWPNLAKRMKVLTQQGRLEEGFRLVESWDLNSLKSPNGDAGSVGILPHRDFILAAIDSGDVALAFEYVGLLPKTIDYYNLLMAAYAIRGDFDAVILAKNTASRRGISHDSLTYILEATAAAMRGDKERAVAALEASQNKAVTSDSSTVDRFLPVLEKLSE